MKLGDRDVIIEPTADGSHTLFVPELNEHYHSVNGARQESEHIFIKTALEQSPETNIRILEVGFGTGLNAYLTLLRLRDTTKVVDYTGLELYPLQESIISQLNYTEKDSSESQELFRQLHRVPWNVRTEITIYFYLTKINTDFRLLNWQVNEPYNIIYFDAFAPDKQPDMWSQDIFDYLYANTAKGGILTTYCAKGVVRRMMQQAGYKVERLPGPPGKREMLRATKG